MNTATVIAFLGLLTCTVAFPNVFNFEIPQEEKTLNEVFKFNRLFDSNKEHSGKRVKLSSFKWNVCSENDIVKLNSLSITPDPVVTPGPLNVALNASIMADCGAPLKGNVTVEKKILDKFIKLPCIDNIGSCTYDDLCGLLEEVNCPDPIVKAGWQCRCPIPKKPFYFKGGFDIDAAVLGSGTYKLHADVTLGNRKPELFNLPMTEFDIPFDIPKGAWHLVGNVTLDTPPVNVVCLEVFVDFEHTD